MNTEKNLEEITSRNSFYLYKKVIKPLGILSTAFLFFDGTQRKTERQAIEFKGLTKKLHYLEKWKAKGEFASINYLIIGILSNCFGENANFVKALAKFVE